MASGENYSSGDWVDTILSQAVEKRASDVHVEPDSDELRIRFRIDGLLNQIKTLDRSDQDLFISRIKVISEMNIAEHRLPQDGHFEFRYQERLYNVRVSIIPTIYGEAAVMRILSREESLLALGDLGFDADQLEVVQKLLAKPFGMVLITGPSGSGKTTLLYSFLNTLNKPTRNIITIEDPVEVQIKGLRQIQVREGDDFNFVHALRTVLRQDPDIIMVGEIRDADSAQIAIQAALTGRLVFSTFHTLNIFAVVARLIEMGIPKSVVANSINGVISPRLLRKICQFCKIPYTPTPAETKLLSEAKVALPSQFFTGQGCEQCLNTGYLGRIGIFEVIDFDDELRSTIVDHPNSAEIFKVLQKRKAAGLVESAMQKIADGATSVQELIRVTGGR